MRALRSLVAVLAWLVATVLLVLAVVLSLTVVLLPVGLLLGFAAIRLYGIGVKLIIPRSRDVEKGVRKEFRRWRRTRQVRTLRHSAKAGRKRTARGVRTVKRRLTGTR